MVRICLTTLLAATAAVAQIGYPGGQYPGGPGQYPGGGYPPGQYPGTGSGIPMPGGHKHKSQNTESLNDDKGKVVAKAENQFSIETTDHRTVTYAVDKNTKFASGGHDASLQAMKIGQTVDVQSSENDDETFTAVNVLIVKQAEPVKAAEKEADDGGPPKLQRGAPEQAKSDAAADDESTAAPMTVVQDAPNDTTSEADDGAPPVLKRGKPKPEERMARVEPPATPAPAAARTPAANAGVVQPSAEDDDGIISPDRAKVESTDDFLEKAREVAEEFTQGLPNFSCKENVTRYQSEAVHGVSWQPVDVVTTTVVYEDGKESYQNLQINGHKADPEKGGAWSYGEFGTVLAQLFNPGLGAKFTYAHDSHYNGFNSKIFDLEVDRPHANWTIREGGQWIRPAYKGSVWIDKTDHRVIRLEMGAVDIPKTFPADHVEMTLEYDHVTLGSHKFLVPVRAEMLSCHRGSPECSKNEIEFRNYKKFGSESDITFGQ